MSYPEPHYYKGFEQYEHHDKVVWVRSKLKGKHREHCLCFSCGKFNMDDPSKKCKIADHLFTFCRLTGCTAPVFECPEFEVQP